MYTGNCLGPQACVIDTQSERTSLLKTYRVRRIHQMGRLATALLDSGLSSLEDKPGRHLKRWWAPGIWGRGQWLSKWPRGSSVDILRACEECAFPGPAQTCRVRHTEHGPCTRSGEALLSCASSLACRNNQHGAWKPAGGGRAPPGPPSPQEIPPAGVVQEA